MTRSDSAVAPTDPGEAHLLCLAPDWSEESVSHSDRRSRRVELDACGIGFVADAHGERSREIVALALTGLACVRHRQAIAADGLSGDGAGILTPMPREFFARVGREALDRELDAERLGVVSAFLDLDDDAALNTAQKAVEEACAAEGIELAGWRSVPIDESHIGAQAQRGLPALLQAIILRPTSADDADAERRAYRARRRAEARCREENVRHYFASWSFATVNYKALVISDRLAGFYPDLDAPDFVAPFVIFHSRFSTNTTPVWERAQPFRNLCHNGEINTLMGNQHRMVARGRLGTEEVGLGPEDLFRPVFDSDDSDSGKLDATIELLQRGGRDVRHAVAMLVPEAWEGQRDLPPGVRDFFRYHACLTDPWDGPAGLVFTDGRRVGAALDRNGLRPLRWQVCEDGLVVCASEVGAVPVTGRGTVKRGRLGPGDMLCVDPDDGVQHDVAVKSWLARLAPYAQWARDGLRPFKIGKAVELMPDDEGLPRRQAAFGLTREEVAMVLKPMATDAKEPTFSMGDDVPFAAVATRPRPLFHYLKQRFAQVSNPPIDHLRERLVMSLRTCLGPREPLLREQAEAARLLELPTFFLYPSALEALLDPDRSPFRTARLDATFPVEAGPEGLERALEALTAGALELVRGGVGILVVSDADVNPERAPIPSLLALGAVHHRLIAERVRQHVSIVVDTGDARDVHALACLLGYGADAVCPRMALQTVAALADDGQLGELHASEAQNKLQAALEDGVLKIFSKMGISTVDGYRAAQISEVLGLAPEVVEMCLRDTVSTVGGVGFAVLGADTLARHARGYGDDEATLEEPGWIRFRKRGGEYHANNPDVVDALQAASGVVTAEDAGDDDTTGELDALEPAPPEDQGKVLILPGNGNGSSGGNGNGSGDAPLPEPDPVEYRAAHLLQRAVGEGRSELYDKFRELVESRPVTELRDLLEIVSDREPIPIEEVEAADAITRRFSTGAMSHGALSKEAHETLAMAMNMVGGRSNCGEGGEDPYRFRTRGMARDRNSRIKQIASGRFGVTPEYCAFADELNIKMAQGSKPGEGGQLPGHKVSGEIARLRHTQPGVGLISPPPHHDIYSIEDLAQLIFDLKQVNPQVEVSVKLVAEENVGTIAAGVVKALAEVVQVSGNNGGTGASPLSSIKHAGMPWELGIADTQQALIENDLRDRVRVRVDGGFRTGRDVLVAALLGADEYSFGTAAMMAEGCIMVRACHRDTCPTGVATQRPNLRAKFSGTPEGVAQYLLFVAEEVRQLLASLGLRTLDEAIGRVELLRQLPLGDPRADTIDLAPLLVPPPAADAVRHFVAHVPIQRPRSELDARLLADGFAALWEGGDTELQYEITNADRTVGASLGGAIGLEWGDALPPGTVTARFAGAAGQSFGAFLADGINLELVGEANDYLGKGQAGGRIVVRPPAGDAGDPVLAGNTVLYGATGGQVFLAGRVGERFAVRNSGATAVVEGAGDHACEYMTGGTCVILGPFGYNLGAGMTGGQAYMYDPEGLLASRLNPQLVEATKLGDDAQVAELLFLVERHRELTGSPLVGGMLADWDATLRCFWRVAPVDEIARIERANEGLLGAPR
jgi:glutamate synthase domain-containing protein 2/glutamate synthase domain-containing protein 1/glutamate synthase domain-containing protein 3